MDAFNITFLLTGIIIIQIGIVVILATMIFGAKSPRKR